LQFARPDGPDLEGREAADLNMHLAGCGDCSVLAQNHRRLDDHLGRAMHAIEVPVGLREQILHRLAADRSDRQRRWLAYGLRIGAFAASVLLVLWGWYAFYTPPLPAVYVEEVGKTYNMRRLGPEGVDEELRKVRGRWSYAAPTFVNYEYLIASPAMAVLPGAHESKRPIEVPQLVFAYQNDRGRMSVAWIYIVPSGQYRIEEPTTSDPAYQFQTDVQESRDRSYTYLIMYRGDPWRKWLWEKERD